MEANRVADQLPDSPLVVRRGVVEIGVEVDLPVPAHFDGAVSNAQNVAGKELVDALEQRLAGKAELKAEVVLEPVQIGLDLGNKWEQGLDLGREVENAVRDCVVERLDAEAIARHDERARVLVPERQGKHAPEAVEARFSPLTKSV